MSRKRVGSIKGGWSSITAGSTWFFGCAATCCVLNEGKKNVCLGKRAANKGESDSFGKLQHISILCVWSVLVLALLSCHSHQNNYDYHWHNYISFLSFHIIIIIIAGNSKPDLQGTKPQVKKTVPWVLPKRWKTSGFSEGAQGSLHKHEYIIYSLLQGFGNPQPTPRKIQETEICSKEKLCGDT